VIVSNVWSDQRHDGCSTENDTGKEGATECSDGMCVAAHVLHCAFFTLIVVFVLNFSIVVVIHC